MLYADNLIVVKLSLSWDSLTLVLAEKTSTWMMCGVQELNLTCGTVSTPAGTHITVDTIRTSASSVQVKKKKLRALKNVFGFSY